MTRQSSRTPAPVDDPAVKEFMSALDGMFERMLKATDARALAKINTTPHEGRALSWLDRNAPALMSELAGGLKIPLSTATHLVNRLVEKGHVLRERSEQDRRIVSVNLSPSGKRLYQRMNEFRMEACRQVMLKLQPMERQDLIALLRKTAD